MIETKTYPRTAADEAAEENANQAATEGKWDEFKPAPEAKDVGHGALSGAGLPPIETVGDAIDAAAGHASAKESTARFAERPPEAGPPVPYPKR